MQELLGLTSSSNGDVGESMGQSTKALQVIFHIPSLINNNDCDLSRKVDDDVK